MRMRIGLSVALIVLGFSGVAAATFIHPTDAPVDRLVANAEAYLREHPCGPAPAARTALCDPEGYYVLARVHYLAWSFKTGRVPLQYGQRADGMPPVVDSFGASLYRDSDLLVMQEARRRVEEEMGVGNQSPMTPEIEKQYRERWVQVVNALRAANWSPPQLAAEVLDRHAEQALRNFRIALEYSPDNGLYHLGLASLAEEYAPRAGERQLAFEGTLPAPTAEDARQQWLAAALPHYRRAFELSSSQDVNLQYPTIEGIQHLVSYEAVAGYRRIAAVLPRGADAQLLAAMQAHVGRLDTMRVGATPVVFSLEPHASLAELIDADAAVAFDLDGTGRRQLWTWPHAHTGILVWDPQATGIVASGRQLFGSVTWWVLPGDGYRALALLDDDRDGQLAGDELPGLAVWFDRNGDGVSDPGEVVPLQDLPIAAISTEYTGHEGRSPMNPQGIRLDDGSFLPSYDWIAAPAAS